MATFFNLTTEGKINSLTYIIAIGNSLIKFYAICPLRADKQHLPAITEFITRANYGLGLGCFELNHDDEIRFLISLNCNETTPSQAILNDSFYLPANIFEHYGDGLASVLFGFESAHEAIERIENGENKTRR